jgi:glycerol-3-phosphate dehydrogenase (NAD(P)+)
MKNIGIIGEGSWATALVKVLQINGHKVNWLIRFDEIKEGIIQTRHNPSYLSDIELDVEKINFYNQVEKFFYESELIFFVLPAIFTEYFLVDVNKDFLKDKYIISATKGILPQSNLTLTQFFNQKYNIPRHYLGFLSGPSHAEEVAMERLTFLTIMTENNQLSEIIVNLLSNRFIKISINSDIEGAEYATAIKNIIAIAAGIIHSLGFGDNFLSVLVSNGIKEIENFINTIVPNKRNITDFVYLGDLLVTCYSQFSRNRTLGVMLGKGYSLKAAQLEMNMIAEGYYAVKSIMEIARSRNIDMPICQAVYDIIYQRYSPTIEIKLLIDKLK